MARWLISTPNELYNGVTEGVKFTNGRAVVEDEITRNVLVNDYGYQAKEVQEETAEAPAPAPKKAKK